MSDKKFFRFLRGELNGFWLQSISYFINDWIKEHILPLFTYWKKMQFTLSGDTEYDNISSSDLKGIAQFAGVLQLLTSTNLANNMFRMTESHLNDDGVERSERGLWDKENEVFEFFHEDVDVKDYFQFFHTNETETSDIVNEANSALQSSLVPTGQNVVGYIPEGIDMYDSDGKFISSNVLTEAPSDMAYSEYYGGNFLQLTENEILKRTNPDNALRMTESNIVDGIEYSERGLRYNNYADITDIVSEASSELQMSLVPAGQEIIGYIAEGTIMYDTDGNFLPERLLSEPPSGVAYTDYYGNTFLQLQESYVVNRIVPNTLLKEVIESIQKVKLNGASTALLAEITGDLVGDFIKLDYFVSHSYYVEWYYTVSGETTDNRTIRLQVWLSFIESYFPQVQLVENL
jgi:hypothetical protein